MPRFAVRFLHARFRDEPVRPAANSQMPGTWPGDDAGQRRAVRQPVPLHRLPAHPGRRGKRWRPPLDIRAVRRELRLKLPQPAGHSRWTCHATAKKRLPDARPLARCWRRRAHPDAQIVAGCTDVGLWVTKQHRDLGAGARSAPGGRTAPRGRYRRHRIAIGAAVTPRPTPLMRWWRTGAVHPFTWRLPACRCATPARWAATSPTARRSATARRC